MLTALKALLADTGQFINVYIGQDLDTIRDFSDETPAAFITFGPTDFGENLMDNGVMQAADYMVTVVIACEADVLDTLESLTISTLLGYQHSPTHTQLEVVGSDNYKITGHYYLRQIEFRTRTHFRAT